MLGVERISRGQLRPYHKGTVTQHSTISEVRSIYMHTPLDAELLNLTW